MQNASSKVLSLFSGCGGLDLGFESVGFETALAYDLRKDAVSSWNRNRKNKVARVFDVRSLTLSQLDKHYGTVFCPKGVIGGPPCQGFSLANRNGSEGDPRNNLVADFVSLCIQLDQRSPLDFIVMENVPSIRGARGGGRLEAVIALLTDRGFSVRQEILDAVDYGVPQRRKRLFMIAIRRIGNVDPNWQAPEPVILRRTVHQHIGHLPEPLIGPRGQDSDMSVPFHENHWAMVPKSVKFSDGTLREGYTDRRSFKTLWWDQPSFTVSYGNREVHFHPSGKRRLSVYEGMLLQGFPEDFVLDGSMSSQITQVSEAVPPPLAGVVAASIKETIQVTRLAAGRARS